MNIFENCVNSNQQGSIGEARAIFEYTKMGYSILKPVFNTKYDLVIEKNGNFQRVQVKTSSHFESGRKGIYSVIVDTRSGARGVYTPRKDEDYDILFVLVSDDRCWSIPTPAIDARTKITLGNTKYTEYQLGAVA